MNHVLIEGIVCMLVVGCFWTSTGIAIGLAPRKGVKIATLEFFLAIVNLLFLGALAIGQGVPQTSAATLSWVVAVLVGDGFFNYFQHDFMSSAMAKGPNGIIWSLVQSGFIFPFAYGIIFFGSRLTWGNGLGVCCILVALTLYGLAKNTAASGKWKRLAILAFLCTGTLQILCNTPSYFPHAANAISSTWRALFVNIGMCSGSLFRMAISRDTQQKGTHLDGLKNRYLWIFCAVMLALSLINSIFFNYRGMDRLAEANAGSIAYPLALGASLISFELYAICVKHEKRNAMQITAFVFMLLGTAALFF